MNVTLYVVFAVIYVLFFGWLGAYIATQKGREPIEGAALGILLSIVGIVIEALLPTQLDASA